MNNQFNAMLSALLWAVTLTIGLGTGAALAAEAPDPDPIAERVMEAFDVTGMAVSIVKDGELVAARGYGVKVNGEDDPVTPETIFAIGSVTKSFTSAAAAALVSQGKLSWDDVVAEKLPGYRLANDQLTWESTFRDHLSMRTGLGEQAATWLWLNVDRSREETLHQVRYLEPAHPFRTTFAYSNIGYHAAGQAVAAVSGKTWDDFMRETFFAPLGMTSSDTLLAELEGRDNLAQPHKRRDGETVQVPWQSIKSMAPAGSITSNVIDMANWMRFQLGEGTFEENTIIEAGVFREMHLPHTFIRPDTAYGHLLSDSNIISYGMGWFVLDITGRKVVLHGGMVDGMTSMLALVPAENLGVMILSNINLGHVQTLAFLREYMDVAVADSGIDWVEQMQGISKLYEQMMAAPKAAIEAQHDPDNLPALALEVYAGEYSNDLNGKVTVTFIDDGLTIARDRGAEVKMEHWYGDTFRPESDRFTSEFSLVTFTTSNGIATSFSETSLGTLTRERDQGE